MKARDAVRSATFPWCERQVLKHIGTIQGLENIPAQGPFVVVPNHRSYFDHFVIEFLLHAVRGTPAWFLTKQESFERPLSRIWTEAWYGIPVDRDRPSSQTVRSVQRVLASGEALCVYPEGTRGDGRGLLPFRAGAFRFALAAGVPVVPVGMVGTDTVLARGQKVLRGGRVHIAVGEPLYAPAGESKQRQAEVLAAASRTAIEELILAAESNAATKQRAQALASQGASLVDRLIADGFDEHSRLPREAAGRMEFLISLFMRTAPSNPDLAAQKARLLGLRALDAPLPLKVGYAVRVRRGARRALAADPRHKDAHYVMGRWHLGAPRILGGSTPMAVSHFRASAEASAPGDTRALAALAEAEQAAGNPAGAVDACRRVLEETPREHPRAEGRLRRAEQQLSQLANGARR